MADLSDMKPTVFHNDEKLDSDVSGPSSIVGDIDLDALNTIEETRPDKFVWLISLTASLGGFLFGYDTGIISAVLIYLHQDLGKTLDSSEKELITSITSGGAFIGAIIAGLTADRFGRKGAIYFGCFLFVVGAVVQAASYSIAQMAAGRAIVGFGVGSAAMIIPLYIAELSPAKLRGRMIGLDNMSITGGQLVSYGIGAALGSVTSGWRYMVGLGALPAIILACLLPFCPESPRQLIFHDKPQEAAVVIARIFPSGTAEQVEDKVRHITLHVEAAKAMREGKSDWWLMKQLYVVPSNLRALIAACGLMAISQLSGFNSLMYYSSTLFALIGFDDPVAVGTIIAATNFVFTFLYFNLVDRFGRRRVLLSTMPGMAFFLALAAVAFHWIPINHDLSLASTATINWAAYVVLTSMILFVAFYASGIGNLAWVSAEFFPMEVRSFGTMMMTLSNWGPNIIVSSTFLTQMESTTPTGTFAFYGGICALGWVAVWACYPEVAGMTLEDIKVVFDHGFGVGYARGVRRERLRAEKRDAAAAAAARGDGQLVVEVVGGASV